MLEDYKKFALSKNMFQVSIGLVLATSFQKTVTGISDYLIMPIANYFVGKTNGNWREWIVHPVNGMNIEIGRLIGSLIDFFILSFVLYLIYIKIVKRIWPEADSPIVPPVITKPFYGKIMKRILITRKIKL